MGYDGLTDFKRKLAGTVSEGVTFIHRSVDADDKTGDAAEIWTFEGAGPANLMRAGWSSHSMQPGDKVLVNYLPLRGGGNSGEIKSIVLPNGKTLGNGAS